MKYKVKVYDQPTEYIIQANSKEEAIEQALQTHSHDSYEILKVTAKKI